MSEPNPKIYLLPNLMTAGNLFCGFTATLKILEGALLQASNPDAAGDLFHTAIWFILGACLFDLLDGRLARLGGHESAFGREFDSIADIVSFGVAPALMVYQSSFRNFHAPAGSSRLSIWPVARCVWRVSTPCPPKAKQTAWTTKRISPASPFPPPPV
jgi:phosphatidylserine synthase